MCGFSGFWFLLFLIVVVGVLFYWVILVLLVCVWFFCILVSVVFDCGCWDFALLGFHVILVLFCHLLYYVGCCFM